jgi:hypothetical protein
MPLIGRWALSTIVSPSSSGVILRPRSFTSGNVIYLNGSGLTSSARQRVPGGTDTRLYTHQLEYRPKTTPVLIEQPCANDDRFRHLAFPRAHRLARHRTPPELCAGIGRQNDGHLPSIAPIGSPQIERRDLQRSVRFLSSVLLVPHISNCDVIVKCANVRWSRIPCDVCVLSPPCTDGARVRSQIRGLWSEKVVDYGPGGHGPTIVDLLKIRMTG